MVNKACFVIFMYLNSTFADRQVAAFLMESKKIILLVCLVFVNSTFTLIQTWILLLSL